METGEQSIAVVVSSPVIAWVRAVFVFPDGGGIERTVTRPVPADTEDVPSLIAAFIEELRTVGFDFPEGRAMLRRLLLWGTQDHRRMGA